MSFAAVLACSIITAALVFVLYVAHHVITYKA